MNGAQILNEIAAEFDADQDVAQGTWFGKLCLKVDGKVFAALWGDDVAFKLAGEAHSEALQVDGAQRFDPRGKGHPMAGSSACSGTVRHRKVSLTHQEGKYASH